MTSHAPRALRGLAFGLVAGALYLSAGPLASPQLKALKAQEPQRAARSLAVAQQASARLGLPAGTSLSIRKASTTAEGRTIVRMDQTLNGVRVYGAGTNAQVDAEGAVRLVAQRLLPAPLPAGSPRLTPDQALVIAKAHLGLKGQTLPPTVEQVVFPSSLTGGLAVTWDATQKRLVLDRAASITAKAPSAPTVWAYEVGLGTWNAEDGITGAHLVVDATTGTVLRKQSDIHRQAAPGVAHKGTGRSQYRGDVALDMMKADDGTYALRDLTRGSLPHPLFSNYYGIDITGIFTMYEGHEGGSPWSPNWGENFWFEGNATDTWGDGQAFLGYPNEGTVNGQTAGVDAHHGLAVTWDLYKNVFGRDGIDGQGTTPLAQVHVRDPWTGQVMENAFWGSWQYGMFFGDGTRTEDRALQDSDGNPIVIPGNPGGMTSLTELTITAHELSHGLMWETAALSYGGEPGGMNEASSDIFGALAEAYATRPAGADAAIPNTGATWMIGHQCASTPLRHMKKPSKDYFSADAWYQGLSWLDVHFSSGPLNRWFYFLAQGASASGADEAYSPYLPGGMTGIGNDKAGRIWFKALAEGYLMAQDTYHTAAAGVLSAATDLYGADSAEVSAVKQAYRAINVQIEGEPLLTRVSFPVLHTDGWAGANPGSIMSKANILPMGVTVPLQATVLNNSDTRVTWKVGGHLGDFDSPIPVQNTGWGVINADGTWTTPHKLGWCSLTAVSAADPLQFAQGLAQVINLDCDDDAEQDAVDMARTALSYWMPYSLKPNDSPYGGPWVEDMDADFFQIAIRAAWGVPKSQE